MQQVAILGLNHLVRGESWAQERLRQHAGARLVVEAGWLRFRLSIDEHGLFQESDATTPPDVTLTLPAESAIGATFDREKLFAAVKLGGSAEVAESLAFVFRNLKWDAEGDLAGIVGDIPARRLAMFGQAAATGIQKSIAKATENIAEYAVEDSRLLVSEKDLAAFGNDVNGLRDDLLLLEKRISRL
jgi:ubiquinone biosynthesis protein UbiJ